MTGRHISLFLPIATMPNIVLYVILSLIVKMAHVSIRRKETAFPVRRERRENLWYPEPFPQDHCILDLDHKLLLSVARLLQVQYLGENNETPSYPVIGFLIMPHGRLMVNLLCRRQFKNGKLGPQVNIIFVIDTGCPVTYLSKRAARALLAFPGACLMYTPKTLMVKIHDRPNVTCHINPVKHMTDVNVLGMDYLMLRHLSIQIDVYSISVQLVPTETEAILPLK
jgi:hypothetical protein